MATGTLQIRRDSLTGKGTLNAGEFFLASDDNTVRIGLLGSGESAFSLTSHNHALSGLDEKSYNSLDDLPNLNAYTVTSTFISATSSLSSQFRNFTLTSSFTSATSSLQSQVTTISASTTSISANLSKYTLTSSFTSATANLQSQVTSISADIPKSISGAYWGSISGTLTAQTDLNTAFNARSMTSHNHALSSLAEKSYYSLDSRPNLNAYTLTSSVTGITDYVPVYSSSTSFTTSPITVTSSTVAMSNALQICDDLSNTITDSNSIVVGVSNITSAPRQSIFGAANKIIGVNSFNTIIMGDSNTATQKLCFVSGSGNSVSGIGSVVFGFRNIAKGNYSFIEGGDINGVLGNYAKGGYAHIEGSGNTVNGSYSHAEGLSNTVDGSQSHVQGSGNYVTGDYSHAQGYSVTATGNYSHAEGSYNLASGDYSHTEGLSAKATRHSQYAKSSGSISSRGDSQYSNFILQKQIFSNSNDLMDMNGNYLTLEANKMYNFKIMANCIAINAGASSIVEGDSIAWTITGIVKYVKGIVSFVSSTPGAVLISKDANYNAATVAVEANDSDKRLDIRATGEGDDATFNFSAFVEWVETGF